MGSIGSMMMLKCFNANASFYADCMIFNPTLFVQVTGVTKPGNFDELQARNAKMGVMNNMSQVQQQVGTEAGHGIKRGMTDDDAMQFEERSNKRVAVDNQEMEMA
jgi:hypothetical protein